MVKKTLIKKKQHNILMESFFLKNKLFLNKITRENNTLKFEYRFIDGKKLEKIENKFFDIKTINNSHYIYLDDGCEYKIISNNEDVDKLLNEKRFPNSTFSKYIFLLNYNSTVFSNRVVDCPIDFGLSIFASPFNCHRSVFKKELYLNETIFLENVKIFDTTFENVLWAIDSIFKKEFSFIESVVFGNTSLRRAFFFDTVNFEASELEKETVLESAVFFNNVYLNSSFKSIDIKNLFLEENFILDMNLSKISKISFSEDVNAYFSPAIDDFFLKNNLSYFIGISNLKEHNISNRDTAVVLKNLALKNRDQISALKFNSLEYNKHYKSLKWTKKDISDKFLLLAEREVSNYGESIIKSVTVFILFNFSVFLYTKYVFYTEMLPLNFNSFTKILTPYNIENWTTILHLIFIIINSFIVYEIVKSFRKFSKKL